MQNFVDSKPFIQLFHNEAPYHIETSPLTCYANRLFLYDRDLRHERVNSFP